MFSKLFTGASLALSLFSRQSEASSAVATFGGSNGIEGSVTVSNGAVTVELNITGLAEDYNYSTVTGGRDCFVDGLAYHIHMDWEYNTTRDRLSCPRSETGNHWDPWLGCGGATDNDYCRNDGGCVNSSSVIDDTNSYECSTSNFDSNPYSCEVGDWSGKYGKFEVNLTTYYGMDTLSSPYEVDGDDMSGYSVVFHCNSGARAFCAPFNVTDTSDDTSRPTQSSNNDDVAAVFADVGYVYFQPNGTLTASVDISSISLPSDCGDTLYYRIFNAWSADDCDSATSSCSDYVGSFYDPTVTCATNSSSTYCTGSELCDDSSYSYSCDWSNDRFGCAPGDLSGKFGGFDVSGSTTSFTVSQYDPLMTDLGLIDGYSIVIQCSDTWEIVACAELETYSSGFDITTEGTACDGACFSSSIQLGTIFVMILTVVKMIF